MDHSSQLIRLLISAGAVHFTRCFIARFAFVFMSFAGCHHSAFAQFQFYDASSAISPPTYSSVLEACKNTTSTNVAKMVRGDRQGTTNSFRCVYSDNGGFYYSDYVYGFNCPAGQTYTNGTCSVPNPDDLCKPPLNLANTSGSKAVTACINGCAYDLAISVTSSGKQGSNWAGAGTACTGSEVANSPNLQPPPKTEADDKCQPGTCRAVGVLNGTSYNKCVTCNVIETSNDGTKASSESASGPAGSASSVESENTTQKTVCKDGTCTTTTTVKWQDGSGNQKEASETKSQGQASFCAENPTSLQCKDAEGSWGGSCMAGFQCEGSAVECAIAQASWKSACATEIDPTDSKVTTGNAAMSAGDRPGDHPANNPATSAFSANLDQTNPYGSECPADMPLEVMGQSFSIPLSHACGSFRFMGQIVVAFSLFAAAFIVFGGIKG